MGNELFGVDIAGLVNQHIGPGVLDATLITVTSGTRDAADPTAGTQPTEVSTPCKGFVSDYTTFEIDGTLVQVNDRKILLIGDSINSGNTVPKPNDKITIEGRTYRISGPIKRDPAAATYTCNGRP